MNQLITLSVLTYAKIINLSWILKVFNLLDISVTLFWIAILFLDVLRYWSSNMTILYQIVTTKRTFHYWKKKLALPRIFAWHVTEAQISSPAVDESFDLFVPLLLFLGLDLLLVGQRHHVVVVTVTVIRVTVVAVIQQSVFSTCKKICLFAES